MTHHLKSWPEFFEKVVDGTKTFEVRKDDRNFQVGDVLILEEFEPCKRCGGRGRYQIDAWDSFICDGCGPDHGTRTGRCVTVEVRYITDFMQREGYVVMAVVRT